MDQCNITDSDGRLCVLGTGHAGFHRHPNYIEQTKHTPILLTHVTLLKDGEGMMVAEIDFPLGTNLVLSAPSGGQVFKLSMSMEIASWELLKAHIADAEFLV
jgi:hypothetical protein